MTDIGILYGKDGKVEYISTERARQMISAIDEFTAYKREFENQDTAGADKRIEASNMLNNIKVIRIAAPNEIRAMLPDHLGLSEHELGKLERKCKVRLGRTKI